MLRAGVGFFILFAVWGPQPKSFSPGVRTFVTTGAIGAFLTMFFGATGPIAATMLKTTNLGRLELTATHAACMTAQHSLKITIFGVLGFAYAPWAPLIIAILIAGFAGTLLGTQFLRNMGEISFKRGFNWILTLVAIYLLVLAFIDATA